jgi:hypothetical protein
VQPGVPIPVIFPLLQHLIYFGKHPPALGHPDYPLLIVYFLIHNLFLKKITCLESYALNIFIEYILSKNYGSVYIFMNSWVVKLITSNNIETKQFNDCKLNDLDKTDYILDGISFFF